MLSLHVNAQESNTPPPTRFYSAGVFDHVLTRAELDHILANGDIRDLHGLVAYWENPDGASPSGIVRA